MQGNEGPQKETLPNMDHAHPSVNLQGANRNAPQEELLLNMDPLRGGGTPGEKPLGLGSLPLTGNAVATGHDAKAWRQRPSFTWAFHVRAFQPLAKLGPLRALTASARALSETLGFP